MKRHGSLFFNKTAFDLFFGSISAALMLKYSATLVKKKKINKIRKY